MAKHNYCITACGIDLGLMGPRVIRWKDPGGLSAYDEDEIETFEESRKTGKIKKSVVRGKRYKMRNIDDGDWDALAKKVNKFVVHHSVTYRSKHTYGALNRRGLSATFYIDDDAHKGSDGKMYATIHQTLDMREIAYCTGGVNESSVGVEISLMPQYWENSSLYSESNQKRWKVTPHPVVTDTISGHKFKCHGPTESQVNSLTALITGVRHILPDMPGTFPRTPNGKFRKGVIPGGLSAWKKHTGIINHYNASKVGKIDCMGLDLKALEAELKKQWDS